MKLEQICRVNLVELIRQIEYQPTLDHEAVNLWRIHVNYFHLDYLVENI